MNKRKIQTAALLFSLSTAFAQEVAEPAPVVSEWVPGPQYARMVAEQKENTEPTEVQLPAPVVPEYALPEAEPLQTEEQLYPEVSPTYANLGRRTPDGDWVTAQFSQPLVPREQTRVAVLGYHNFSNSKRPTEMLLRTAEFCQQMQYIRDAGLSVITMQDFLEWRNGTRRLPERCVLITIDDGWKSVYTDAFPVLRAYGYPFTLFLYTRYINVRGASMTHEMIREMIQQGATIGSHSSNHLYPKDWKKKEGNPEAYRAQVVREITQSGEKLRKLFGNCSTYCYPGGYHTPPMQEELKNAGYGAAFTVLESKVECEEPIYEVHRYMVFGVNKEIFRRGVNFDGVLGVVPSREGIAAAAEAAKAFFPKAFEGIVEFPPKKEKKEKPASKQKKPAEPPPAATTEKTPLQNPAPENPPDGVQNNAV